MPEFVDYKAAHQIQIKRLGNAWIYVTCNCLQQLRKYHIHHHKRNKQGRGTGELPMPEVDDAVYSLGDFPVGTPIEVLMEAYNFHLDPTEKEWE